MSSGSSRNGSEKPSALALLSSSRPRNIGPVQAGALLFGDWGTSRLYVLGLAFFFAGSSSFWLIVAMSLLILAVGWAYAQICRIYPDGGGVYAAARSRSQILAVVGALLLFADYVITASLSALDAFHYFGLGHTAQLLAINSPGLWAIISIAAIGLFNLLGPKHTSGFAIVAAIGMILITLLVVGFALPQVPWSAWSHTVDLPHEGPEANWFHFVSIVLALSGVEAIASMSGVLKKPVGRTAGRSLAFVAGEVALFNVILAAIMVMTLGAGGDRSAHKEDMLAHLASFYAGPIVEWFVRVVGGVLLLSAANTAIGGMIAVLYILARDRELPTPMQKLNPFGVPVLPALLALLAPCLVLLISHDLETLSHLYAIGVIGAVAINVTLCASHPRLYGWHRKLPMVALGALLLVIWVTLAITKHEALKFVGVVMVVGLGARFITRYLQSRSGEKPSLIRQAIAEQWKPETSQMPKMLLGTYGSDALAEPAMHLARSHGAALVVCFIRELHLSDRFDSQNQRFTIDNDPAALRTFGRFLEKGHDLGVTVLPAYDTGPDATTLMAETAAMFGCDRVIIGSSRQGTVHRLVKGTFQQRLETCLPPDIHVDVLTPEHAEGVAAPIHARA